MKPARILGFVLLVFLILLGIGFLTPGPELPVTENFSLRIPHSRKILTDAAAATESLWSRGRQPDTEGMQAKDSSYRLDTIVLPPEVPDSFPALQLPGSLYLEAFFRHLSDTASRTRILHYGDSQIEGDRFTAWLRSRMQEAYGAAGPGWFSAEMPVAYTRSLDIRSRGAWERYHYRSRDTLTGAHRRPGLDLAVTVLQGSGREAEKASLRGRPSRFASPGAKAYNKLLVFYGNNTDTTHLKLITTDTVLSDLLPPARGPAVHPLPLQPHNEWDLEFSSPGRIEIYGFSLESSSGVLVDNLPSRGSAGLGFTRLDEIHFDSLLQLVAPDLLLLQYGLNVTGFVTDDYGYYEKGLLRQIRRLQSFLPQTPMILLSLGDIAVPDSLEGDHIDLIIKAQKSAARRAGIGFWNSREAMGGKGSARNWRGHQPPWFTSDLVHLTFAGSGELARRFWKCFYAEAPPRIRIDSMPVPDSLQPAPTLPPGASHRPTSFRKWIGYSSSQPYLFTSRSFWVFFFILLAGFSIAYRKKNLRNTYLFLFSLFFYYKSGGWFFSLLLISTLTDYSVGWMLHKSRKTFWRKTWVFISLLVNLGMLGYYKYAYFFTDLINNSLGTAYPVRDWFASGVNQMAGTQFDVSTITLPVGISFFTFQTISYTLDVYRRKVKPVGNILDFGFYVSFFPQLVAGPIVRASEFIPQLYRQYRLRAREFGHALFLILKGLVKKMILSDFLALHFIDRVFESPQMYTGLENLLASYGYGLQIYCDFSGYTDIAIGLALLMGFRLPVNFNAPYKAVGLRDFWRRWHISLSRWLRDYLYISLGGNRQGRLRTGIHLLITMLLGGLWHGAHYRFVLWGGLHGMGLLVQRLWPARKKKSPPRKGIRFLQLFFTFHFITFTWIFFRAPDLEHVRIMLEQMLLRFQAGSLGNVLQAYTPVMVLLLAGYLLHWIPEKWKEYFRGFVVSRHWAVLLWITILTILLILQFHAAGLQPFIYFRF